MNGHAQRLEGLGVGERGGDAGRGYGDGGFEALGNGVVQFEKKKAKHGGGQSVLTAVCVPSQYYLGSAMVDTKTNEIPVAQKLFPDLDLKGRFVSLDALHMGEDHCRPALRLLFAKRPSLKPP